VLVGIQGFTYTYEPVTVTAVPLLGPLVGGIVVAAVVAALWAGLGPRRSPGVVLLALFSLTVAVVILLGGFSAGRDARYLLPLYSALPLLVAGGIGRLWRWRPIFACTCVRSQVAAARSRQWPPPLGRADFARNRSGMAVARFATEGGPPGRPANIEC
jgi:hypothetical protein